MFDIESVPLHWANRLSFLSRKELTGRFRAAGLDITAEEWAMLLQLWTADARSPTELAQRTVRDPTTVTRLLDRMVRKTLVERHPDPLDRRRSKVLLTDRGRALQAQLLPIAERLIHEAFEGLDADDLATTNRTLRAITENLSQP
jgi:DNA-binding MarR family transcriptional regulator